MGHGHDAEGEDPNAPSEWHLAMVPLPAPPSPNATMAIFLAASAEAA